MSWGRANIPSAPKKVAGLDASDTSSHEESGPVQWGIGPNKWPLTWIVREVYNRDDKEIRTKTGKNKTSVTGYEYYGDLAAVPGLGLLRSITGFIFDNELVWTGNIVRPDDPMHPDYWEKEIQLPNATAYVAWGRPDQPEDTHLLVPLGAADPTLKHPAYRRKIRVILKNCRLGDGGNAPNVIMLGSRQPTPAIGNFPAQDHAQGESIVAGILELLTDPVFGLGLPASRFNAANWEAVSAEVIAAVGRHAPFLDRTVPARSAIKELLAYFDGWIRFENGQLRIGRFPHDGTVPAGLTELTVHDFAERPRGTSGTPSATVNDVVVIYRDGADLLKRKPTSESASDNVEARKASDSRTLEMLGIIDASQARAFAAEAAATGAEGKWERDMRVRRARAVWGNGDRLQAGDNFALDLGAAQVDQVCRITQRVDYYGAPPSFRAIAERGVYPTPYVPPADLKPEAGKILPLEIAQARVLELTPDLAGTPLGIPVAFLAKRPKSQHQTIALQAANVAGFNAWYGGAAGATYDLLGVMPGWAVRGVVREAIASDVADLTVKLTLDADNLDLGRLAAQSAAGQLNDNLLVVIGDELFSVGAIGIAGLDYDLSCKRVRLGSLPAAHGLGVEAWLVWRDELRPFLHSDFIEDTSRYFKLQPYTQTAAIELADVDALLYAFRDRAPELPIIVLDALPGAPSTGVNYNISGQISDVNGDLVSYQVQAARLVASGGAVDSEITLQAGEVTPTEKALKAFKAPLVFPQPGYWVIIVRAYDETGGFKELKSAEMNVGAGTGFYGPDDGVTPDPVTGVTLTAGLSMIVAEWTNPTNTPVLRVLIYVASTAVKPANPIAVADDPQAFYFLQNLPSSATRYFWFEVEARNGRKSTVAGPYSQTTRAGINLGDIVPGMTLVEIVGALPGSGNFDGRTVFLTTDKKLYRYSAGAGAFIKSVETVDLTGQITETQVADDSISTPKLKALVVTAEKVAANAITAEKLAANSVTAGVIAAGAITAFAVGANEIIANTANLADAIVTSAKIASLVAEKITAGVLTAMLLSAAKTASDSVVYNPSHGAGSTMPTVGFQQAASAPGSKAAGTHYFSLLTIYGWATGSGFAENRFSKGSMVFDATFHSSVSLPTNADFADVYGVYQVNGGGWIRMAPGSRNNFYSGGGAFTAGQVQIGLNSTDVVEIGVEVVLPATRTIQTVVAKAVWGNL